MSTMAAFVGAGAGALATQFGTSSSKLAVRSSSTQNGVTPSTIHMGVRFDYGGGGLDRLSAAPYGYTRYLFQDRPKSTKVCDSEGEVQSAFTSIYRHVFGNAYLMEEEREELAVAESKFKMGEIGMRDFIRAIAKSNAYKSRFFDRVSQYRFFELNFIHLLGRAPLDQTEISAHYGIFAEGGYEAEIDSYIDSQEYSDVFGEDTAPYMRFRGTYSPNSTFNSQCKLQGGWARSDKNLPVMSMSVLAAKAPVPAYQIVDGLPPIPNSEHPSKKYEIPSASYEKLKSELATAKSKVLEFQLELTAAYNMLEDSRKFLSPFMNMAADMQLPQLYGRKFGNGAVNVFSGKYLGTGSGEWGVTGAEKVRGRSRRVAMDIGAKEARLEKTKQLVVDLERAVGLIEAEIEKPPMSPAALMRIKEYVKVEGEKPVVVAVEPELLGGKIQVSVVRSLADIAALKPEPEVEKSEGPKVYKPYDANALPKPKFPGDGSEMNIGG
uniref:PBS-linker domain-containing protein n=1 Tax=Timspurckia oligopyrenoides TaxID=708627 RepID=A0A7S0ZG35_9RHOD|mmetsp:Transcript_3859/g.6743  ORF Transcript_3859/g.6743 Transcript_3859/m.6743 type:complete len:493 (+) Transcript_3859:40-1518(+)